MAIQEVKFKEIADAIREKEGTVDPIVANDFASRILSLETGTGGQDIGVEYIFFQFFGANFGKYGTTNFEKTVTLGKSYKKIIFIFSVLDRGSMFRYGEFQVMTISGAAPKILNNNVDMYKYTICGIGEREGGYEVGSNLTFFVKMYNNSNLTQQYGGLMIALGLC